MADDLWGLSLCAVRFFFGLLSCGNKGCIVFCRGDIFFNGMGFRGLWSLANYVMLNGGRGNSFNFTY